MRISKKVMGVLLTAALVSIPFTAMAASSISSVSLRISSDIEAGSDSSDVEVTTTSSKYDVDDVEVRNEPDDGWDDGDKPKLKVTLTADTDSYYFASGFSKSKVSLSGDDGTVTSVSREDTGTLYVYITLDALDDDDDDDDSDYDLDVSGLEWDESDATAYWDEAEDAAKYEVRLYRGSSTVTSILTTTNSSYNFAQYFTKSGTYSFKVRGVYNSSNKGSWEESDSWYVSTSEAEDIYANRSTTSSGSSNGPASGGSSNGAWLEDAVGWWYCNADKTYTMNNWQYIDGAWYYFNGSGYMMTGWIPWNNAWYYCGSDGAMLTSTTTPDGYYVGSDGAWIQ